MTDKTIKKCIQESFSFKEVLLRLVKYHDISMNILELKKFINDHNLSNNHMKYNDDRKYSSNIWCVPNFEKIVKSSNTFQDIVDGIYNEFKFPISRALVKKRIEHDAVDVSHMTHCNYSTSEFKKVSDKDFSDIVKNCKTLADVLRHLNYGSKRAVSVKKRIKKLGLDTSHFDRTVNAKQKRMCDILQNVVPYSSSSSLKKRLIKEGYMENKCVDCGNRGKWMKKKLVLQLDHINGDHHDNSLKNLAIRCPNCHSQTETFGVKNTAYINKDSDYADKHNTITQAEFEKRNSEKDKKKLCSCGNNKWHSSNMCLTCAQKKQSSKSNKPSLEILQEDLKNLKTYRAVGEKYNVSDNAIRKWFKSYNIDPPKIYKSRT